MKKRPLFNGLLFYCIQSFRLIIIVSSGNTIGSLKTNFTPFFPLPLRNLIVISLGCFNTLSLLIFFNKAGPIPYILPWSSTRASPPSSVLTSKLSRYISKYPATELQSKLRCSGLQNDLPCVSFISLPKLNLSLSLCDHHTLFVIPAVLIAGKSNTVYR